MRHAGLGAAAHAYAPGKPIAAIFLHQRLHRAGEENLCSLPFGPSFSGSCLTCHLKALAVGAAAGIPVLAGSTAYAIGEARRWKTGLDNMPWQAKGFYSVISAAIFLGLGIDYSDLDPIKALYWSAVLNGVIVVPMMAAMMYVAGHRRKMGRFRAGPVLGSLGWISTAVMAAATDTMVYVNLN